MLHEIKLSISENQLLSFKQEVEKLADGTVTDSLLLLTILLQKDVDSADVYADMTFDGGGNSIRDVLNDGEWDNCFTENKYEDSD